MRYNHRQIYLVAAGVILAVVLAPLYAAGHLRAATRDSAATELTTVLTLSHDAVAAWAEEHMTAVSLWSEEIAGLLPAPSSDDTQTDFAHRATDSLRPVLGLGQYQGYILLDSTGATIASNIADAIGLDDIATGEPDLMTRTLAGETVLVASQALPPTLTESGDPTSGLPTILAAAPVMGPDEVPVGTLIFAIDPRESFTSILRRGRVGASGETYAFNSSGVLISESRFDDTLREMGLIDANRSSAMGLRLAVPGAASADPAGEEPSWPLTRMAAAAVVGEDGMDLDGYQDYRGEEVIGAWLWDDALGFGLATEVDVAQAYGDLSTTVRAFFVAAIVFVVMVVIVASLVIRKRTQLIDAGEELRKANDALESRIRELTRSREALKATEGRLQALVRTKDDFIASVSHELRTPLTAMVGFAQMLQENIDVLSPEEQKEMLDALVRGGAELSTIVEDLLTAAKAAQGDLTVESVPVELSDLATDVVERSGGIGSKELSVVPGRAWATGDEHRIRQILRNLISNAIRYGGDRIEVTTGRSASGVYLAVSDNGDGIADGDAEHMFDPYQRAGNAPGVQGSLGLGLAISRRLAGLMNGALSYRREGDFTVFELTLPALDRQNGAPLAEKPVARSETDWPQLKSDHLRPMGVVTSRRRQ